MAETIIGFAAWHPTKGFDDFHYEGPVVFADLGDTLDGVQEEVSDLNESDGTTTKDGWRAVKVEVRKL